MTRAMMMGGAVLCVEFCQICRVNNDGFLFIVVYDRMPWISFDGGYYHGDGLELLCAMKEDWQEEVRGGGKSEGEV